MDRRSFLAAASLTFVAPRLLAQGSVRTDLLRRGFGYLQPALRQRVQTELKTAGFYRGAIDGRYGPATQGALIEGAEFIRHNSRGRVGFDLGTQQGIVAYYRGLASGELAKWLYGEGNECANGC